ncbi:hypothetical protein [Natronorarus salvus]|uniref:hypothetical protein n=1 Tax=Natronorarus salvus TaxID=3117733 RepID=UPI002F26C6CA
MATEKDRLPSDGTMRIVGIALLLVGTVLLVGLLPSVGVTPTMIAGIAVLALAVGTLLVSISRSERAV